MSRLIWEVPAEAGEESLGGAPPSKALDVLQGTSLFHTNLFF